MKSFALLACLFVKSYASCADLTYSVVHTNSHWSDSSPNLTLYQKYQETYDVTVTISIESESADTDCSDYTYEVLDQTSYITMGGLNTYSTAFQGAANAVSETLVLNYEFFGSSLRDTTKTVNWRVTNNAGN